MAGDLQIHPSAIVDDGAVLGDGCRVWHFVHISAGARIGRDCSFGQNVYVGNHVRIGDRVKKIFTINECATFVDLGYGAASVEMAPGLKLPQAQLNQVVPVPPITPLEQNAGTVRNLAVVPLKVRPIKYRSGPSAM